VEPRDIPAPFRFEFDSTNRILRAAFWDVVTDDDVTSFYRMLAEQSVALDPLAGILDLSGVTSFEVTVHTIRHLAWSEPAMPHPNRPRFIIAGSSHIFGMARMFEFEGESSRPNLHVVRSSREVWAILGIDEPQFEHLPVVLDSNRDFSA
jgi:hypothetical protein